MKSFSLRIFTPWWMALLSLLLLAGCGSDSNPISPTASSINQVNSANSTVPANVFSATLTGSEQVIPVNSAATATGLVIVDLNTRQMKATIVTSDITGTQAHIHQAAKGLAGPVVFPLTQTSASSGVWKTTTTLTEEQLATLKAGNYYFNVHSAAFPDGEIRGQILAQLPKSGSAISIPSDTTGTTSGSSADTTTSASGASSTSTTAPGLANRPVFYINVLTGSQVLPDTSSTASATGISVYRPLDKSLTSVVVSIGINGTGTHIRQAASGAIGPIVSSLNETDSGSGIWTSRTTLNDTQAQALTAGSMYYEILSAAFPNGELRGQIVKTQGATQKQVSTTGTATTTGTDTTTGTPVTTGTGTTTGSGTTPTPTPTTTTTTTETGTTTTTGTGTVTGSLPTTTTGTGSIGTGGTTPGSNTIVTTDSSSAGVTPMTNTVTSATTMTGTGTTLPASSSIVK